MNQVIVVPSQEFTGVASDMLAEAIRGTAQAGEAFVALSGGRTVAPIYRGLARRTRIEWDRVKIFQTDERIVPFSHPHNNARLIQDELLAQLKPTPTFYRMRTEDGADKEAARYAEMLPDQLSVAFLGVGEDGHICSLFSTSSDAFASSTKTCVTHSPSPPIHQRISITPHYLVRTERMIVVAKGSHKASAVRRALETCSADIDAVPASIASNGTWILDESAAADLTGKP